MQSCYICLLRNNRSCSDSSPKDNMGICRDGSDEVIQERRIGGNRAVLFVYGNVFHLNDSSKQTLGSCVNQISTFVLIGAAMEALESMAFVSNAVSLVTYFFGYMNFSLTKSGYTILTIQAHFKFLRPFPCKEVALDSTHQCESAHPGQGAVLFLGLYLVAIGTGGVKAALPSLGADQFDEKDPKEAASLSSFFNWFLFSLTIGSVAGVIFLVWISSNEGWEWSFGACAVAVFFGCFFLYMGKSSFRHNVPKGSPIVRILQVFIAAIRNRNLPLPDMTDELHETHDKEAGTSTEILSRTDQFR
ncbi:hypothetical protein Scep_000476 [Stephania cephalantha]|uniref:Uncharacterized protein n=1 Tax=Stephania cephalantha TaxID=152367 RepID=A0AAP0L8Y3_9MAGN